VLLCVSCVVSPCEFLRRDFYDNDLRQFTERENNCAENFVSPSKPKSREFPCFLHRIVVSRANRHSLPGCFSSPPKKIIRRLSNAGLLLALHFGSDPSRTLFSNDNAKAKATPHFQTSETIQIRIIITALQVTCKAFLIFS
jgi:hypothetical protein